MHFIDEATIRVRAGHGGDGIVSFRREKYRPRGGPDGGDGGKGGDVVLVASGGLRTLVDYRYRSQYRAGDGKRGGPNNRTGKSGDNVVLPMPVGTVVYDEQGNLLADLTVHGQRLVVARGGRGGKGNARFARPWRQAPNFATRGEEGQECIVRLELKLLADVGIIGLPNAGKSTLINRISKARAKVADYPFTTLVPNLGVVRVGEGESFVVADMPGLIEGASSGAGLGQRFLRHCDRATVLLHLVDVVHNEDPVEALLAVERELLAHARDFGEKRSVIAANKCDLPGWESGARLLERLARQREVPFFAVSALTGMGVRELVLELASMVLGRVRGRGGPTKERRRDGEVWV